MNLKDAFRFQNKLALLTQEVTSVLSIDDNITVTETTYLRRKAVPDAEDEVVMGTPLTQFHGQINELVEFLLYLLGEREKLSAAICETKASLNLDFDSATGLNNLRHSTVSTLRRMADLRPNEHILRNGGQGYRLNVEGNQVSYRCDVKHVTTINFDRNLVRRYITKLSRQADEVSAALDSALINSQVNYTQPFEVGDSFTEIFTAFCETAKA